MGAGKLFGQHFNVKVVYVDNGIAIILLCFSIRHFSHSRL